MTRITAGGRQPPRGEKARLYAYGLVLLLLAGCARKEPLRVGALYDWTLGDKSFHDQVHAALLHAKTKYGIGYEYVETNKSLDVAGAVESLIRHGCGLVIANGFTFSEEVTHAARRHPEIRFVCTYYAARPGVSLPPNLRGLGFRGEEGSYLVGALAGLVSRTGVVGFVGGMLAPVVRRYELGFAAGARAARPGVRVIAAYAGQTVEAFENPAKGLELAAAMYGQGADVVYHAADRTGLGVFDAARRAGRWAIGVEMDQRELGLDPRTGRSVVLTSMVIRVEPPLHEAIADCLTGRFAGGMRELGLAEGGVGYVYDEHNRDLIPAAVIRKVETFRDGIIQGRIVVPRR